MQQGGRWVPWLDLLAEDDGERGRPFGVLLDEGEDGSVKVVEDLG